MLKFAEVTRRMAKRLISFLTVAILLFPAGYFGAQIVWYCFHHRYDIPQTGFYHGYASVLFDGWNQPFDGLSFHAKSSPRWYWRQPTNFAYTKLDVEWWDESAHRRATVNLPAFTYRLDNEVGAFTRGVLAGWLCGGATNQ